MADKAMMNPQVMLSTLAVALSKTMCIIIGLGR